MTATTGYVYVATGEGYVREAEMSARSLRAISPAAKICLITDLPRSSDAPFDTVIVRADVQRNTADKLLAIDAPYDRIVFLDTDTFVCGPLDELFALVERFDLALLQENQRGWDYELPGVPLAFPEYNTGVIAFRRTPEVRAFFAAWRESYERLRAEKGLKSDQPAFRAALFHSSLRVATIPSEFHFLGNVPNYAMWQVRLVHGRGDLPRIAALVNEQLGPRAFVPLVGVMRGYRGRRTWMAQLVRFAARTLRLLVRPPRDPSSLTPHKWWL